MQSKDTLQQNLCKDVGIDSPGFPRWFTRLCNFNEIKTQCTPKYLYKLIPLKNNTYDNW